MLKFLGSILKLSLLTLVILVLSHVIEIQGVSVSEHVLRGMKLVTGFSPSRQINEITGSYARSMKSHLEQVEAVDSGINPEDQKALQQVIDRAQRKK
jgi:hypothetical protein